MAQEDVLVAAMGWMRIVKSPAHEDPYRNSKYLLWWDAYLAGDSQSWIDLGG
jgi:hypothetical protein